MGRRGRSRVATMQATMARIRWWLAGGLAVVVASCLPSEQQDPTGVRATTEELRAARLGVIDKGPITFGESIRDVSLSDGERHGFTFHGSQGAIVRAKQSAQIDGRPDALLLLLGPPDGPGKLREILTWDDNGAGHRNALIDEFRLPASGEYQLIATSYRQQGAGTYTISLTCLSLQCAEAAPSTDQRTLTGYERTRLAAEDIFQGRVTTDEIFRIGDFLFDHHFAVEEGFGNGLRDLPGGRGGPPNLRRVQWKRFGGPDTTHCSRCHSVGGADGGGDRLTDVFQEGDGENTESALERNAPALLGLGYIERLAGEMTDELKEEVSSARRLAESRHRSQTIVLEAKGIPFGTARVEADGQFVEADLQGVDQDLVVRPLGWKGHTSTIRRFVDDALRTHLGIQTDAAVARNCQHPDPEVMGSGPDCRDPDGDGVTSEFTDGQLTALSVYVALTQVPVRVEPADPVALQRATAGEALFSSLGCTLCHVQQLPLENPVHVEDPDVAAGPPVV